MSLFFNRQLNVRVFVCLFVLQLLLLRGYAFNHSADFETVRMMKEKLCYVGYNIEQEQKLALETTVLVESYTVHFSPWWWGCGRGRSNWAVLQSITGSHEDTDIYRSVSGTVGKFFSHQNVQRMKTLTSLYRCEFPKSAAVDSSSGAEMVMRLNLLWFFWIGPWSWLPGRELLLSLFGHLVFVIFFIKWTDRKVWDWLCENHSLGRS